jgi:hypothetical protein
LLCDGPERLASSWQTAHSSMMLTVEPDGTPKPLSGTALTRAKPALVRSARRMRSCFASAAIIAITASLKTPHESKYGSETIPQR